MGQQQLLLLILGIVIVGVAVIVGIEAFNSSSSQNQADTLLNRNVRIAQEAVNWRARSTIHGGGGNGSYAPLATDGFDKMGIAANIYSTEHAVLSASGLTLEIVGVSSVNPNVGSYLRLNGNTIDSTAVRLDGSISLP